jgi:murein DD-endopeptidase MepM/ murein hydrolase activator NlpD
MPAGSLDRRYPGPLEATIHLPRPLRRALAAFGTMAIAIVAVPANADTSSQLDTAKQEAAAAQAELDRVAASWQAAEARLAVAQDAAAAARTRIGELEGRLADVQVRLNERAAALYMAGGDPTVMALITSGSVEDVADRLQFADAVAQRDADLATAVSVQAQELAWERERLAAAVSDGQAAVAQLQSQSDAIRSRVADLQSRVGTLQEQLAAEQAAAAATTSPPTGGDTSGGDTTGSPPPITGSGWLLTCPVNGPTSFTDSFGDPRPGGRSHEGIDLIAGFGTPVVAVHSGTVHRTSSSTGGYGTVIFHDGTADWTFYTHFSSYAGPGEGSHVSAGDTIGLVGATGDTTVNHLHFEYHPGGGAAVDPYSALLGVC